MEKRLYLQKIRNIEKVNMSVGQHPSSSYDAVRQTQGDESHQKRRKIESQFPEQEETSNESNAAILQIHIDNGYQKRLKIESQRPKTEGERVASNMALLQKYNKRYITKVKFLEFDENGHTRWEIRSIVRGRQNRPTSVPYTSEITPETGTLIGGNYNRRHDEQLRVAGTKAFHLSDILYCQIEASKVAIKRAVSELPELEGFTIPEFDLKKSIEKTIVNKPSKKMISEFLGEKQSETYTEGRDKSFDAFADAPIVESKLRLAHRYNKDCTSIKIAKAEHDRFPSTELDFSDRDGTI